MKMEQTEGSKTLAYKIQTPGDYPEESIQHLEHGESLTSRILVFIQHYHLFWRSTSAIVKQATVPLMMKNTQWDDVT